MIRCIPVDGSEPFEKHSDSETAPNYSRSHGAGGPAVFTLNQCASATGRVIRLVDSPRGVLMCRIESWRERAERLETELAALHSAALTAYGETVALDQALDAIENRSTVILPRPTRSLRQE